MIIQTAVKSHNKRYLNDGRNHHQRKTQLSVSPPFVTYRRSSAVSELFARLQCSVEKSVPRATSVYIVCALLGQQIGGILFLRPSLCRVSRSRPRVRVCGWFVDSRFYNTDRSERILLRDTPGFTQRSHLSNRGEAKLPRQIVSASSSSSEVCFSAFGPWRLAAGQIRGLYR